MRSLIYWMLAGWLGILGMVHAAEEERAGVLQVVTEHSPPLQYAEGGKVFGPAVDIVEAVLREAGLAWRIQAMPWARAYKTATTQPDVLIFSISRTREREPLFTWVGPIVPIRYGLYALRSRQDIVVGSLEDAKRYLTGVVNQDVRHQYLLGQGFPEGKQSGLFPVSDQELNYRMLFAGRIDLIAMGNLACLSGRVECSKLRKVVDLEALDSGLYMAFSRGSHPGWVDRVRSAFASLRDSGALQKLQAPPEGQPELSDPGSD